MPLHRMEIRNTYAETSPNQSEPVLCESFGVEVLTISPTNSDSTSSMLDFLLANLCKFEISLQTFPLQMQPKDLFF